MSKKVIMLSVAVLFGMQAGLAMAANPELALAVVWASSCGLIMRTRRISRHK